MSFFLSFLVLFIFWILLSGHFDLLHLALGIFSSLLVSAYAGGMLFEKKNLGDFPRKAVKFLFYLPWLFYQILIANLDVVYRTLHPKMPIDPQIVRLTAYLETEYAKVTLAHSITLTPGTVTIDVHEGEYIVHALSRSSAKGLFDGTFQKKIKRLEE